ETHADALGIELPTVYVMTERAALPYLVSNGKDTALVLTADDLEARALEATRFRAALACAAQAMGVPGFVALDFGPFMTAVLGFAQAVLPQQSFRPAPPVDNYSKALPRKVRDGLQPFVLQIANSLEEATLSIEYQAMQLTCMRYAIATMRDP